MDSLDHNFLNARLVEASLVLHQLDSIDRKERNVSCSVILHEALFVYTELLSCRATMALVKWESDGVQTIIDRLRAKLLFFGEDV